MTAYSLSPGLSGLGSIIKETSNKDAGIFQMPMPASNSDDAVMLDIFGASRKIRIEGKFVLGDSGYSTIALFIAALDALVNGAQTNQTYTSGKSGSSYNVLIETVEWSNEEGSPNSVEYSISMTEGST